MSKCRAKPCSYNEPSPHPLANKRIAFSNALAGVCGLNAKVLPTSPLSHSLLGLAMWVGCPSSATDFALAHLGTVRG